MAFAPDGRIFVAQQTGALRVIKNGTLLATPFVSLVVNSSGERGLIGIALDPDFITNNFIYLYYTTNAAPIHNRIVRYTANGDVAQVGSEQIVLDLDNLSGATNHNGGALSFGLDGKLYVAVGDNATGSNAQNLDTYHGKLLRINKDGSAPTDNPFYSVSATEQRKRVWAYGLRNPYTFSIQPGTGKIFVNDVGQGTVEEINDATQGGQNFGWPAAEGNSNNPQYSNPVYLYLHSGPAPIGCAITGGTFFNPTNTNFPASYLGKYFFQDYCSNWIYSLDLSGTPTATLFASNAGGSGVSLSAGPDGNLYYLSRGSQALYRIVSTSTNPPIITAHPLSVSKSIGEQVEFSVTASGTSPLQYQWYKNDAPISASNSPTYSIDNVQPTHAGNYKVLVSNTAGQATSHVASLTVLANVKPTAQITSPEQNSTYAAGTILSFSGTGTDPEDGVLQAAAMSWQINFHHDTHKHDEPPRIGISSGTFEIPDQGETSANVWYRIILSVTDSYGSVGKDSVDVLPRKSRITFSTLPVALQLTLDGQPITTPVSIESVEGLKREIGVVNTQEINGTEYDFVNWQHGGSATQMITTPIDDITYTAVFSPILSADRRNDVLEIFPTPARDWLQVKHLESLTLVLTDLMGRTYDVPREREGDLTRLNVSGLPTAFYILSVSNPKRVERRKILVMHE